MIYKGINMSNGRLARNLTRMKDKMESIINVLDEIGHPKAGRVIAGSFLFGGNLHVYTKQYNHALLLLDELSIMQSKLQDEIETKKISEDIFKDAKGFVWIKDVAYADLDVLITKISSHRSHKSVMYRLIELSEKIESIIKILR